jgi:predicted DNA-binding WGR domain protein
MADWEIHLEYKDAKSNKFWRAKTEGGELVINYGRIGSDGQTKVKDFGDGASAQAEMTKVAASKRKKGYADTEGGSQAPPPAQEVVIAPVALDEPQAAKLSLQSGGRQVAVELQRDGDRITTSVVETYASAEDAATAYGRIEAAMKADGYT